MKLSIGQKLYYVPNCGPCRHVTITKLGRKWAELDTVGGRMDIETLIMDGGKYIPPGICYLSKEIYDAGTMLSAAWDEFRRDIKFMPLPITVKSLDQIQKARECLGIVRK